MANFYDNWLGFWEVAQAEKRASKTVIHEEELEWIETPQDFRIALMAAPENGFHTWGSEYILAEIPPGCHTGKHEHGEEGIFIVEGEGFSIVNETKYEWNKGSAVWIPFGAQHQHFNTGLDTVRYFSMTCLHLEHWLGMGKLDQLEIKGPTDTYSDVPLSATGFDHLGRRIALKFEESVEVKLGAPPEDEGSYETVAIDQDNLEANNNEMTRGGHRDFTRSLMAAKSRETNGFLNREVEIGPVMGEDEGHHGGGHSHMEACLYIVEGEGYSIVAGEKVPWKKGSLLHVQGPQTSHQHFNTGNTRVEMLRAVPGIRSNFMQPLAAERFPVLWFGPRGVNQA